MKYLLIITLAVAVSAGVALACTTTTKTIFNPDGTITFCTQTCCNGHCTVQCM